MANVGTMIERMSDYLNVGRPGVKAITVRCRRATAMRFVKPKWRGGPLIANGREIVTIDPVPCPTPPQPKKAKKKKGAASE